MCILVELRAMLACYWADPCCSAAAGMRSQRAASASLSVARAARQGCCSARLPPCATRTSVLVVPLKNLASAAQWRPGGTALRVCACYATRVHSPADAHLSGLPVPRRTGSRGARAGSRSPPHSTELGRLPVFWTQARRHGRLSPGSWPLSPGQAGSVTPTTGVGSNEPEPDLQLVTSHRLASFFFDPVDTVEMYKKKPLSQGYVVTPTEAGR